MALVNPNIAMSFRQPDIQAPNALAQFAQIQQIQGGRQAQELAQYQLGAAQRGEARDVARINALAGAGTDETAVANALLKSGDIAGYSAFVKAAEDRRTQKLTQQKTEGEIAGQPTALAQAQSTLLDNKLKQARSFLDTIDPAAPDAPQRYLAWHEANHRDPIVGPALAARGISAEQARQNIMDAIQKGPQAFANLLSQSKLGTEKFMEMNKPTTQVIDQSGQRQILQQPGLGGPFTNVGTFADVPLPANVQAQKMQTARAGAPSISVSTEKKFGEVFGGKVAEADVGKLATAEKAPQLAESANRIIDLVQRGDVFTGPIADVKLNIARALNVAGASNQDKIANTEALVAATGQSTLDAIKGAGLGAGQGFTDKDLKFLQGVAGGTINLTAQTLTELATLQHRAATRAAAAWNKRSQEIPKEVMQGTGLSTAPITVPPLSKGRAAAGNVVVTPDGQSHTFPTPAAAAQFKKAVGL
jgi:hypothetical protein